MKIKLLPVMLLGLFYFANAQIGIGVNTANPLGAFHIDGAKDNAVSPTVAQQANDVVVTSAGDVSIGATTVDSSAKLQINTTNKGLLIPRVMITSPNDGTTIPSPAKGLIVYNMNATTSMVEGFYTNIGTPAAPLWVTYQQYDKTIWKFENFYDSVASAPVDQAVTSGTTINNINLGLSITVTVPAFTQAKLVTTYSVPMGTTSSNNNLSGYYGIRFLKNGTELPIGSRKSTLFASSSAASPSSRMFSISATVGDTVVNNTSAPVSVTYALNGYVEPTVGSDTIRFNMWSTTDPNFNWGKGYMSVQVFTKTTL